MRNQKGFTLMELMVVIVIVAILAAVAVPLYINYVKDAQRTEAKGAIGAVITLRDRTELEGLVRELASVPEFAQGHFLGNQLSGAGLDLLPLSGAKLPDFVIHVRGHGYSLSLFSRARCASKRSSAFRINSR